MVIQLENLLNNVNLTNIHKTQKNIKKFPKKSVNEIDEKYFYQEKIKQEYLSNNKLLLPFTSNKINNEILELINKLNTDIISYQKVLQKSKIKYPVFPKEIRKKIYQDYTLVREYINIINNAGLNLNNFSTLQNKFNILTGIIIQNNEYLVRAIAYKYKPVITNSILSINDLLQAGKEGILHALDKYNPEKGEFISYGK